MVSYYKMGKIAWDYRKNKSSSAERAIVIKSTVKWGLQWLFCMSL